MVKAARDKCTRCHTLNGRIVCYNGADKVIIDKPEELISIGYDTIDYKQLGLGRYLSA